MIIHQLLHGYSDGHRLLSNSIDLDNQSAKLILSQSDLAGHGDIPPESGYVTGYPVPHMRMYALSHTWMAPEMPRPGCVWTHTLLVEFSDLADITGSSLLSLFNRPIGLFDPSDYDTVISSVNDNRECDTGLASEQNCIAAIMGALYEFPSENVYVYADDYNRIVKIAMAIWSYQWPKLKRNFRFCTWAPTDRSRPAHRFDLQFVPVNRQTLNNRARNAGVYVDLANCAPQSSSWIDAVTGNGLDMMPEKLSQFLKKYGADTTDDRAAFIPLTMVWLALKSRPVKSDVIVSYLKPETASASLVKKMIIDIARYLAEDHNSSPTITEYILSNLRFVDNITDQNDITVLASAIWKTAPTKIWEFFRSPILVEQKIATAAIHLMQASDIIMGGTQDPELFGTIIRDNLRFVEDPSIWDAPSPLPTIVASFIPRDQETAACVLPVLFKSTNPSAAYYAINLFGPLAIKTAAEMYTIDTNRRTSEKWLIEAKHFPEVLSYALINGIFSVQILNFLSGICYYQSRFTTENVDEWACALNMAHKPDLRLPGSLSVFVMARALSGVSPEPGVLIKHAFDSLHSDILKSNLDNELWYKLSQELPEASFLDNWDRGHRLRLGVLWTFINRGLSPQSLVEVTKDKKALQMIIKSALTFHEGRKLASQLNLSGALSYKIKPESKTQKMLNKIRITH